MPKKLLTPLVGGIGLIVGLFLLVGAGLVRAEPQLLIVTKVTDSNDGQCDADCSLREAIIAANRDSQADTIQLAAGVYRLTIKGKDEEAAATGDLDVSAPLTLIGAGPAATIIEANEPDDRVLDLLPDANTVLISDVTIRGGQSDTSGGGIFSRDVDFTLNNVVVRDNIATIRGGGLNIEGGNVTIEASQILNNRANDGIGGPVDFAGGGGVYLANGHLRLIGGQILSNTVGAGQNSYGGGGLCVCPLPGWSADLIQTGETTIAYNRTKFGGGLGVVTLPVPLFTSKATATLNGAQIISNTATEHGGGVNILFGEMTINGGQIAANVSEQDGAGLSIYSEGGILSPAKATLNEVQVRDNGAERDGGGLYLKKSVLNLTGGQVMNNRAAKKAGGVFLFDGEARLNELWLVGNSAGDGGGGVYRRGSGQLDINRSCISHNSDTSVYSEGSLVAAGGNWWGVIDGPSGAGPGHGDSISSNVEAGDFLTSAILGCPTRWLVELGIGQQQTINDRTGQITYTLTFSNHGVQSAPNVIIENVLPPGLTEVAVTPPPGQFNLSQTSGLTYQWQVAALPVDVSGQITLTGRISSGQVLTNVATITAPTSVDTNPANNRTQLTFSPLLLTVTATQPPGNGRVITAGRPVAATFNRAVDIGAVTTRTFTVWGKQTGVYEGIYIPTGSLDAIRFEPLSKFKAGEEIVINLSEQIKAPDGVALRSFTWQLRAPVSEGGGRFRDSEQGLGEFRSFDVALGDLDGDGDLDAFVANTGDLGPGSGQPNQVWLNGQQNLPLGTFALSQSLGDEVSTAVALGDVDGDGDLDAVVGNWKQKNQVWLNGEQGDPPGVFSLSNDDGLTGEAASQAVALADLNGDGYLDMFVANEGSPNTVWFNDGSNQGRFYPGQTLPIPTQSWDVALGDVNGDGAMDAVVVNKEQPNEIWFNDGHGNFQLAQSLDSDNERSRAVALGDLDGDGDLDVIIGNGFQLGQDNEIWLNGAEGQPVGVFSLAQSLPAANTWDVALGDVDGDGDLDLFAGNLGPNEVWLNNGAGLFSDSNQHPGRSASFAIALGDVDLDDDLDAFAGAFLTNQANQVWLNQQIGPSPSTDIALYLPAILNRSSATPKTDIYITSINTNGIDYIYIIDPLKGTLLGRCGEDDGQPVIGNDITMFCTAIIPSPNSTAYKIGAKAIKCGYGEEIFFDAVGLPLIRSVTC